MTPEITIFNNHHFKSFFQNGGNTRMYFMFVSSRHYSMWRLCFSSTILNEFSQSRFNFNDNFNVSYLFVGHRNTY